MYLTNRISLSASLTGSMKGVKSWMGFYPSLRQLSEGNKLRYMISDANFPQRFHVIELDKESITISTSSITSPLYFIKETVLRLISVSMAVSKEYRIDFYGALPYFTYALLNSETPKPENNSPNMNRDSDILLSKRVVELLSSNSALNKLNGQLCSKLASILSVVLIYKYGSDIEPDKVAKDMGVGLEVVQQALRELMNQGYRAINQGNGRFEVVKL